jgi:hypothetical protein
MSYTLSPMRERGIVRIGVVGLLVPLLLGVTPAAAKKKHKKPKSPPVTVVSASQSTSTDGQQVTVTATCPSGLIAVGGGVNAPLVIASGGFTDANLIYESRRTGDSGWQVSAAREDVGGSGPSLGLTAYVDCRSSALTLKKPAGKKATASKKKKKQKLTVFEVSSSGSAPDVSGTQASATAACPSGTQALGGGFSSSPAPQLAGPTAFPLFYASYRNTPTSWLAAFTNNGTTARSVTSYAYCAAKLAVTETSGSATLGGSSPGNLQSATATSAGCPAKKALLGGGFNITPPADTSAITLLTASFPANGTWQVSGSNLNTVPGSLSSSGYCA